ncbi:hypothetical protein [Brevibacillus migulae]|uniref:hypothetical protein n=1 Tax=Brevibacillus migulae TaxID=1644114 RepID=UPI00106EBF03|nr:hypothetical protein [Brevibacillus migulae]
MLAFVVEPKKGIGPIHLGMSKEEVDNCLAEYDTKYYDSFRDKNFFKNTYKVEYDSEGKVIFIEVSSYEGNGKFSCTIMNMDIFETKVDDLVESIDKISPYDRNDWELGYTYHFPELQLCFWRPNILTEQDMLEDWFKELNEDNKEYEMQSLYFSTVAIAVEGYWKRS